MQSQQQQPRSSKKDKYLYAQSITYAINSVFSYNTSRNSICIIDRNMLATDALYMMQHITKINLNNNLVRITKIDWIKRVLTHHTQGCKSITITSKIKRNDSSSAILRYWAMYLADTCQVVITVYIVGTVYRHRNKIDNFTCEQTFS